MTFKNCILKFKNNKKERFFENKIIASNLCDLYKCYVGKESKNYKEDLQKNIINEDSCRYIFSYEDHLELHEKYKKFFSNFMKKINNSGIQKCCFHFC